jgi:hypothetical protein
MKPLHEIAGRLGNQMFQFAFIYAQMRRGIIPDVWVQSPKYFAEFADEIQKMFGEGITPDSRVSIHVRRTDYLQDKAFANLCTSDYYERAAAMFPQDRFLVFSDDPAWCEQKWGHDPRFEFVPRVMSTEWRPESVAADVIDLNRMAGCKSNIIANSSFSWWAAFLNPNPAKVVVYPKMWHADGVQRIEFPPSWVAL